MLKKIEAGCFRALVDDESRVLLVRHGDHKNNYPTPEAVIQGNVTGYLLRTAGVNIDAAVTSPSPRAIEQALNIMKGFGKMTYPQTDNRLADLAHHNGSIADALKARVKEIGLEPDDPGIAAVMHNPAEGIFYEEMVGMANEAANAIFDSRRVGKTVLVTSHGVGRIEPALQVLKGQTVHQAERLTETGQVIEIILTSNGTVVEENWFETVQIIPPAKK